MSNLEAMFVLLCISSAFNVILVLVLAEVLT